MFGGVEGGDESSAEGGRRRFFGVEVVEEVGGAGFEGVERLAGAELATERRFLTAPIVDDFGAEVGGKRVARRSVDAKRGVASA